VKCQPQVILQLQLRVCVIHRGMIPRLLRVVAVHGTATVRVHRVPQVRGLVRPAILVQVLVGTVALAVAILDQVLVGINHGYHC